MNRRAACRPGQGAGARRGLLPAGIATLAPSATGRRLRPLDRRRRARRHGVSRAARRRCGTILAASFPPRGACSASRSTTRRRNRRARARRGLLAAGRALRARRGLPRFDARKARESKGGDRSGGARRSRRGSVSIPAPLLEREWAARAGLGSFGKNTNLLHPGAGSLFLLAELLLSLDLAPDLPVADLCGACTRCLEACPTGALPSAYRLESSRCISYWTIEQRGEIPPSCRAGLGDWVFGCDICQEVCPWNGDPVRELAGGVRESRRRGGSSRWPPCWAARRATSGRASRGTPLLRPKVGRPEAKCRRGDGQPARSGIYWRLWPRRSRAAPRWSAALRLGAGGDRHSGGEGSPAASPRRRGGSGPAFRAGGGPRPPLTAGRERLIYFQGSNSQ